MRPDTPFYRTLRFRIGIVVFAILLVVDTLTYPVWDWLYYQLTPEWSDPEFVRRAADELEVLPESDRDLAALEPFDRRDSLVMFGAIAAYAIVFSLFVSLLVSRMATRRIAILSNQAARPVGDDDDIPGPFEVRGSDEIHQLSVTMNGMREKILALLRSAKLQDARRREWIAGVSHDLRTPMTALAFSVDECLELVEALEPTEQRRKLERQLEAARLDAARMIELGEDLLDLARLDAGDEPIAEPVPPGELLRTAVSALQPIADREGIELALEFPTGLRELLADGRRLIRALENLVLNSIQHARSRVSVTAAEEANALVIAVEDDGPGFPATEGMSPEEATETFRGLGLRIARRLIEVHDGTLSVENHEEGGARLTIRLPRHSGGDASG